MHVVLVTDHVDLAPEVDAVIEQTVLHATGPLIVSVEVVLHVEPGVLVEVAETEKVHGVLVGVRPLGLVIVSGSSEDDRKRVLMFPSLSMRPH